jgi:AraC-like DNA-binding protein
VNAPALVTAPCFSARLVRPFVRLLRGYPQIPQEGLDELEAFDPDTRVPIATIHELLAGAEFLTGDPDLGLKAARLIAPGDYGVLEYAARSAATWRGACDALWRYMRLVNDALCYSVQEEGELAQLRLDSKVALPRASADFQSAAFYVSVAYWWPDNFQPDLEVCFLHPRPADVSEYERTFPTGRLRFEAPFNGFVFPKEYLELPVQGADPHLHAVLRKHADAMLAELPRAQSLTERARDLVVKELAGGTPTLGHVARRLALSERTLARRLDEEGTTFKALLEDSRRRLSLRYVRESELAFGEIAFLLGFSQTAAFYRAFRRWTGQTPLEWRRAPVDPSAGPRTSQ